MNRVRFRLLACLRALRDAPDAATLARLTGGASCGRWLPERRVFCDAPAPCVHHPRPPRRPPPGDYLPVERGRPFDAWCPALPLPAYHLLAGARPVHDWIVLGPSPGPAASPPNGLLWHVAGAPAVLPAAPRPAERILWCTTGGGASAQRLAAALRGHTARWGAVVSRHRPRVHLDVAWGPDATPLLRRAVRGLEQRYPAPPGPPTAAGLRVHLRLRSAADVVAALRGWRHGRWLRALQVEVLRGDEGRPDLRGLLHTLCPGRLLPPGAVVPGLRDGRPQRVGLELRVLGGSNPTLWRRTRRDTQGRRVRHHLWLPQGWVDAAGDALRGWWPRRT